MEQGKDSKAMSLERLEAEGQYVVCADSGVVVADLLAGGEDQCAVAREIARRWNAHKDLYAALEAQHTVKLMGYTAAAAERLGLTEAWNRAGVAGLGRAIVEMTEAALKKATP